MNDTESLLHSMNTVQQL